MKIELEPRGKYLIVQAEGRLDAAWADHFTDTLFRQIRQGRHQLVIDAAEMGFLSSAGIRALLLVHKELNTVKGSFTIVNPTAFVAQTLATCGFRTWLADGFPEDLPAAGGGEGETAAIRHFRLHANARLSLSRPADWRPWQGVGEKAVQTLAFSGNTFALGIGSAAGTVAEARELCGEFLAAAGNVVFQPPGGQAPPDYLIATRDFIPRLQCIQALAWQGEMGHLIRFASTDDTPFHPLSALLARILNHAGKRAAGFVMLGEIEGLVGTALIRSPGTLRETRVIPFPEIRDWLTFCGERAHAHQQALLAGVVARPGGNCLPPLPSRPEMAAHVHAAVFPYQPLPNGKIDLFEMLARFFGGAPPLAVMHLAEDARPVVGLGESALVRGAVWFSPLENPEVLS